MSIAVPVSGGLARNIKWSVSLLPGLRNIAADVD